MLNFNLTKNDIGYLRLLIDIQSCEEDKRNAKNTLYSDSDTAAKYSIYDDTNIKSRKNSY